jgi:hypothetical protein
MTYDPIDTGQSDRTVDGNVTLSDIASDGNISAQGDIDAQEVTAIDAILEIINGANTNISNPNRALTSTGSGDLFFTNKPVTLSEGNQKRIEIGRAPSQSVGASGDNTTDTESSSSQNISFSSRFSSTPVVTIAPDNTASFVNVYVNNIGIDDFDIVYRNISTSSRTVNSVDWIAIGDA